MEDIINELNEINNILGEIYTKGRDSFLLVQCRQRLFNVIERIDEPKKMEINFEDKKE